MDDGFQLKLETSTPKHSEEGCNCSCCPEFKWKTCKQFGDGAKNERRKDQLSLYRKEILFPLIQNYFLLESNGAGSKGIHLNLHRHFSPYEKRKEYLLKKEIPSIPLFPIYWDIENVDKTIEHAILVFKKIKDNFNQPNLQIYLSHGSSGRPSISVISAYSSFVRAGNLDWRLYNLTVDDYYGSVKGEKFKGYHMTIDSSKFWQDESAEQKKEITHLKTELAGLDSELLKVTSLLSDYGSALSTESVRINSLLEKKSEEE